MSEDDRTDIFSPEKRSQVMQSIRSENTRFEVEFRRLLWKCGIRGYRLHWPVRGKPDLAWPGRKVAVFLDSDFWHGWNWNQLRPKLKNEFWEKKISSTMRRDEENTERLTKEGWTVLRIWGHEIKDNPQSCVERIGSALNK